MTLVCEQEFLLVLCWNFGISWRLNYNNMTFVGVRMLSSKKEEPHFSLLPFFQKASLTSMPCLCSFFTFRCHCSHIPFSLILWDVLHSYFFIFKLNCFSFLLHVPQQLIWASLPLLLLLFNDVISCQGCTLPTKVLTINNHSNDLNQGSVGSQPLWSGLWSVVSLTPAILVQTKLKRCGCMGQTRLVWKQQ